jgi:hypothetical protein
MLFTLLCLSLLGGITTNLAVGETGDVRREVPHIGAHQALDLFKSGRMILLDVMAEAGKVRSEIVGAFYIPADKLDKIKLNVPEQMLLGVFCD